MAGEEIALAPGAELEHGSCERRADRDGVRDERRKARALEAREARLRGEATGA